MTSLLDKIGYDVTNCQIFYALLFIASGLWIWHIRQQKSKLFKLGEKMPGPPRIPLFGNSLLLVNKKPYEILNIALHCVKRYGSVVRFWLGSRLIVFLADADDIEIILSSQVHLDKSFEYEFFKPWLGEGLLTSTGEKWRYHRKIIAPTFHMNILKSFINVFNQNSKILLDKLQPEIGKSFDIHKYLCGTTVDILLETAMGITKEAQVKSGIHYAMAVMKMCDIIHQRQYKFWLRFESLFKLTPLYKTQIGLLNIIHGLTNQVIKIKKQNYSDNEAKGIMPPTIHELTRSAEPVSRDLNKDNKPFSDTAFKGYRDDLDINDEDDIGEKKRLAFLDLMIDSAQNGTNKISDREIKEQVDTIMFEGHDTTSAGCSFVLCLLGIHQHIQDKVYDELYEIFGDSDRPATFADTLNMKYLERVILESLRLYPPVPIIARNLKRNVKINTNNYVIPAGATVVVASFRVHRNPKYYKKPHQFDPDNFLPENTQDRHFYSFIPFSAGPRSCVGRKYAMLKLKILLSTILRHYKTISDVPEKKFLLQADVILKRVDGFTIKIEPRKRVLPQTA